MSEDPTKRFSKRVQQYLAYRPGYPTAIIDCLRDECRLRVGSVVADIGSGTGILAEMLLRQGYLVYGVEPNQEMRQAAEILLQEYPNFVSLPDRAEATRLADHSIDLITAGQAFHWFEPAAARVEFRRILRADGCVALVWNERKQSGAPFMTAYESFLQEYGIDYHRVRQVDSYVDIGGFFVGPVEMCRFDNQQSFDFSGLKGRFLSSSYSPLPGHAAHAEALRVLHDLFERFQQQGRIRFEYDTRLFWGRLT